MAKHMKQDKKWPRPEGEPLKFGGITWRQLIDVLSQYPDWMLDMEAVIVLDEPNDIRIGAENPIAGVCTYYMDGNFDSWDNNIQLFLWDKE